MASKKRRKGRRVRRKRRVEEILVEHGEDERAQWVTFRLNLKLPNWFRLEIMEGLQALGCFARMTLLEAGDCIGVTKMEEHTWKDVEGPAIAIVARKILVAGYARHLYINGAKYSEWPIAPMAVGICPHCKQLKDVEVTSDWRSCGARRVYLSGGGEFHPPRETARMASHHDKKGSPGNTCRGNGKPPAIGVDPGPLAFFSSMWRNRL